MMKYFRLGFKEVLNNKKFTTFFVINLALGLSGFIALDAFKGGIERALHERSKGILAADIGFGARRPLADNEKATADTILQGYVDRVEVFETYSMLAGPQRSRLVEVKAVDDAYPFYGEIELASGTLIARGGAKQLSEKPLMWVYPELLLQLQLNIGDQIRLGDVYFTIADAIVRDSSGVGGGFSFAPPVYVSRAQFAKTGLIQFGTTGYYSILYQLHPEQNTEALAKILHDAFEDPAIRVFTHRNASEQVGRMLDQLNDYLGLAALVALFLTALGTAFLYRSFLAKRFRDVAIYKSLGFTELEIEGIFLIQIISLGLIAAVPLAFMSWFALPFIADLGSQLLQIDLAVTLTPSTLFLAFFASTVGALLTCFPLLQRLRHIKAKDLFQGSEFHEPRLSLAGLLRYAPALSVFYGLSVWVAKSWRVSGLFIGAFLGSFLILFLIGTILLKMFENPPLSWPLGIRLPLRNLTRQKFSTVSLFLAVSLGVLLLNLIPQVQSALQAELQNPEGLHVPSLFLFDIQEDQLNELQALVEQEGHQLRHVSPMVRARLARVNGEEFQKAQRERGFSREDERENRFRNRGFNLTYRQELSDSESIVKGRPFSRDGGPQISLEERFAERLNLEIGDELVFDISGIEIAGRVVNLRKVRWTSFQPNFFIQFNEGVLEEAPKTFLAALSGLSAEQKALIQNKIVDQLPNISLIDVSRVIERLSGIIDQMSIALRAMAFLSVLVGLVILFSIANHQAHERRREVSLLKVVGSELHQVHGFFLFEFGATVLLAAALGVALSFAISGVLSSYIFKSSPQFDYGAATLTLLTVIALSLAVIHLAIRRVLKTKPRELLA